ncbi:MAG TPA: hypothetical protein VEQ16_05955 [Acidocella sp.]|jgi:hypothetical protein|nr:hypothetical protein [Acidocella sp.]
MEYFDGGEYVQPKEQPMRKNPQTSGIGIGCGDFLRDTAAVYAALQSVWARAPAVSGFSKLVCS